MENNQLPPDWEFLLQPFQSLFSKTGFRYFCVFVMVLAHLDKRMCVTKVILAQYWIRHFTNFYRFLDRKKWNIVKVRQQLITLCLEVAIQSKKYLFVAVDDTVAQKMGLHFEGAGFHHDPMNKQHKKQISWGHNFVCLAILAQSVPEHFVALFVGCALYVQKAVCEETKRNFSTKLELASSLLAEFVVPTHVVVVAVCDGAYARRTFIQPVLQQGQQVISRLRSDTVFYDLPPERPLKANGKYFPGQPRKYGERHKARDWSEQKEGWECISLVLYGNRKHIEYKTAIVIQRTFGCTIRIVAVRFPHKKVVYLFSTDTSLSVEEIIRAYCARFAIETGFRNAKQSFGFSTYQVRKEARIVSLVHLCLWSQTLLQLKLWNIRPDSPRYGSWRKPLSYLTLPQQKELSQSQIRIFEGLGSEVFSA